MQVNIFKKYIKKCLCLYICFAIVFVPLCPEGKVSAASKIKLSKTSLTIKAGKSKTIKLKKNGKKLKAKFSSNRPKIAKVNKKSGKITGKKKGKCTITAKYAGKKYKCKVKVTKKTSAKSKTSASSESSNPDNSTENKTPYVSNSPDNSGAGDGYYPDGDGTGGTYYPDGDGAGGIYYPDGDSSGDGYYPDGDGTGDIYYPDGENPGADYTQRPGTTKRPSVSTKPRNTQRPGTTRKPSATAGDTDFPYEEDPYGTYSPSGDTDFPYEEDPYGTYSPSGDTDFPYEEDPYGTYSPSGDTDFPYEEDPYGTNKPANTKRPQTSQNPYNTQTPANTKKPQASQNPYNTQTPSVTQKPLYSQPPQEPDYDYNPGDSGMDGPWTGDDNTPEEDPDEPGYNDWEQDTGLKHYLTPYWTNNINIYDNTGSSFTMGSKKYTQGICEPASANSGTFRTNRAIYNLDSQFSTVSFDAGCLNYSGNSSASIYIYADGYTTGSRIEELKVFLWGNEVKHITINTTGIKQLQIQISGSYGVYGIGNLAGEGGHVFECIAMEKETIQRNGEITYKCKYCDETYTETIPAQTSCKPGLIPCKEENAYFIDSDYGGRCFKVMGKEYYKGIVPDYTRKLVEWTFKLDKKYSSITFSTAPLDNNFNNKILIGLCLYVYADGKRLTWYDDGKREEFINLATLMSTKTFKINTQGVTELRFQSSGEIDDQFAFFDIKGETATINKHELQNVNGREKCVNCGCYND